jgi:diaminopimelate decarboxylase
MSTKEKLDFISEQETPFYFYDLDLLRRTLSELNKHRGSYKVHYALKANSNPVLLRVIREAGLGADCVSGNEITRALSCGFPPDEIAFAGVGKTDREIITGLENGIFSFNVESIPELENINALAAARNLKANIALRVNPNVDAYTHKYITTGLEENKFGINPHEFSLVSSRIREMKNVTLKGIHFHIGSQIQDLTPFRNLCVRMNEITRWFLQHHHQLDHINAGGGLGINYFEPDTHSVVDFSAFFSVFRKFLELPAPLQVHFELGRSVVGQCGNLVSRVLYVKEGVKTSFVILDAGMTELIRPALYQAYHKIENLTGTGRELKKYDVVGPICESSDCFGKAVVMHETKRGDIVAIRSAGAYGEVMSSRYNLRGEVRSFFYPVLS